MKSIFKLYIFKLVILSLTMIFIIFGANASTTEQFFGYCKTYQNNGFKLETDTDVACHVAFVNLVEPNILTGCGKLGSSFTHLQMVGIETLYILATSPTRI
jgi:hypothetical protein